MRTIAPILEWLPAYRREWLARDLVAGAAAPPRFESLDEAAARFEESGASLPGQCPGAG